MTHVLPSSEKLRRRAQGMVMELAGVGREEAIRLLDESGGDTSAAIAKALRRP